MGDVGKQRRALGEELAAIFSRYTWAQLSRLTEVSVPTLKRTLEILISADADARLQATTVSGIAAGLGLNQGELVWRLNGGEPLRPLEDDAATTSVDARLDGVEGRLGKLEVTLGEVRVEVARISQRLGADPPEA